MNKIDHNIKLYHINNITLSMELPPLAPFDVFLNSSYFFLEQFFIVVFTCSNIGNWLVENLLFNLLSLCVLSKVGYLGRPCVK